MAATQTGFKEYLWSFLCVTGLALPPLTIAIKVPEWLPETESSDSTKPLADNRQSESNGGEVQIGNFTVPIKDIPQSLLAVLAFGAAASQVRNLRAWLGLDRREASTLMTSGNVYDGKSVGQSEASASTSSQNSEVDLSNRQSTAAANVSLNFFENADCVAHERATGSRSLTGDAVEHFKAGMKVALTSILREHIRRLLSAADPVITGLKRERHCRKYRARHSTNLQDTYNAIHELCQLTWFHEAAAKYGGAVAKKLVLLRDAESKIGDWLHTFSELELAKKHGDVDDEVQVELQFQQLFLGAAHDIQTLMDSLNTLNDECFRAGSAIDRIQELEHPAAGNDFVSASTS